MHISCEHTLSHLKKPRLNFQTANMTGDKNTRRAIIESAIKPRDSAGIKDKKAPAEAGAFCYNMLGCRTAGFLFISPTDRGPFPHQLYFRDRDRQRKTLYFL